MRKTRQGFYTKPSTENTPGHPTNVFSVGLLYGKKIQIRSIGNSKLLNDQENNEPDGEKTNASDDSEWTALLPMKEQKDTILAASSEPPLQHVSQPSSAIVVMSRLEVSGFVTVPFGAVIANL